MEDLALPQAQSVQAVAGTGQGGHGQRDGNGAECLCGVHGLAFSVAVGAVVPAVVALVASLAAVTSAA